jgi:hypothetical protein
MRQEAGSTAWLGSIRAATAWPGPSTRRRAWHDPISRLHSESGQQHYHQQQQH